MSDNVPVYNKMRATTLPKYNMVVVHVAARQSSEIAQHMSSEIACSAQQRDTRFYMHHMYIGIHDHTHGPSST